MADEAQPLDLQNVEPLLPPPAPRQRSLLYRTFVGPDGLRAGWKVFLFFLVFALASAAMLPLMKLHAKVNPKAPMPVDVALLNEFLGVVAVVFATWFMARWIDRKPWAYFGMPLRNALRSSFWIGSVIGLAALALQLEIMHLCGWFDFGTQQLHGGAIVKYGALWAVMFFLVGVTEEGILRGYVQRVTTDGLSMLSNGWSFWVSAILFSIMFGAAHLGNPGENKFGIVMVFIDGMAMCFSLWRTGDLWFAIGNHAAWDWGQTFLFGTPNSGTHGQNALMVPSFHGPTLLPAAPTAPRAACWC